MQCLQSQRTICTARYGHYGTRETVFMDLGVFFARVVTERNFCVRRTLNNKAHVFFLRVMHQERVCQYGALRTYVEIHVRPYRMVLLVLQQQQGNNCNHLSWAQWIYWQTIRLEGCRFYLVKPAIDPPPLVVSSKPYIWCCMDGTNCVRSLLHCTVFVLRYKHLKCCS